MTVLKACGAFSLPYEFVVPDVMFEDEFLDLGN